MNLTFINISREIAQEIWDECTVPEYSECQRVYHDIRHIVEGIEFVNFARMSGSQMLYSFDLNDIQMIAWLFHDSVYVVGSDNNEDESCNQLINLHSYFPPIKDNFSIDEIYHACDIIQDTKNHESRHPMSESVLDLDMMRLASNKYEVLYHMLYKEYIDAGVPKKDFFNGRLEFLLHTQSTQIYNTPYAQNLWERKAKVNIANEIQKVKNIIGDNYETEKHLIPGFV